MVNLEIEKVATENPFVDELMYYTKYLAYNAVIKDEDKATNEESVESAKNGLLYRLCIEGRVTIDMLYDQITEDILVPISSDSTEYGVPVDVATSEGSTVAGDLLGYDDSTTETDFRIVYDDEGNPEIDDETGMTVIEYYQKVVAKYKYAKYYSENPAELPRQIKTYLLPVLRQKFIDEYVELNNYYRMLNGQPDYGDDGLDVRDYYSQCGIDSSTEKGAIIIANIEGSSNNTDPVYIHELGVNQLSLAVSYGILDAMQADHPECSYLWYLRDNKIDIYTARLAYNFQLLYLPEIDLIETYERFKTRYEINRDLVIRTVYSQAMKYDSDYYNEFIIIYILLNTMVDCVCVLQEIIARREFIDSRCIKYIFSMYQIPYYEEIPIKYQINIMKSVNNLLKFKSTSKNMQDICALFGFKNIEIYRYYILRLHKYGSDNFPTTYENDEDNYDLYFIKVPLGDAADLYVRDENNYLDYDDITNKDDYWDGEYGELKHETIKKEHKIGKDGEIYSFAYRKSKYISIDTINDIAATSYYISYFNGILFDQWNLNAEHANSTDGETHTHKYMEDDIRIRVTAIDNNERFPISDLFVLLFDLAFAYYDIESTIQYETKRVLYVWGFNFEDVLNTFEAVKEDLHNKGYDIDALLGQETDVDPFHLEDTFNSTPSTETTFILTAENLVELFNTNTEMYKLVVREMFNADNYDIFKAYELIYDAFMVTKYNREFFSNAYIKDEDSVTGTTVYDTLTEYLMYTNNTLYEVVKEVSEITEETTKIKRITNLIYYIVQAIDKALDDETISSYIYSNLPGVSAEYVQNYMAKIINFFKSFRVQLYNVNTILEVGSEEFGKYTTYFKYHDDALVSLYSTKRDHYDMDDDILYTTNLRKEDHYKMMDKIEFSK